MDAGKPPRRSIRRPVVISAADGEPAIEVTARQLRITKMIAAAIGSLPIAILLLFFGNTDSVAGTSVSVATQVADPATEEVARVKAEAKGDTEGKDGIFFISCTEKSSGGAPAREYRQLSYRAGSVRESSSADCGNPPANR